MKGVKGLAEAAGTFLLGGSKKICRLGYGAMRLTGPGIWGEPKDRNEAKKVLRHVIELGVNFIDTADSYGPEVSENLIGEALHPYPKDLVIATKGGLTRQGPDIWTPCGRAEYLRQCCEMSLRRLKLECIDLYQLHRIDPKVPVEESIGELKKLQDEGKIRYIGLSEVSVDELKKAQKIVDIVSVQNLYNLGNRQSDPLLQHCEKNNIAFIPWFPIQSGDLAKGGGLLDKIAKQKNATAAQVALAWLLHRSKVMIPIPGTSSVKHLEENIAAASIEFSKEEIDGLNKFA